MSGEQHIATKLALLGVRVRPKNESRIMRLIAFFWPAFGSFWTTISGRTIWAPIGTDLTLAGLHRKRLVIEHELVHIGQARRWPVLWQIGYLLAPVPLGIAYVRWVSERRAYLVQIEAGVMTAADVADTLWRSYGWCWPRPWIRAWYAKRGLR